MMLLLLSGKWIENQTSNVNRETMRSGGTNSEHLNSTIVHWGRCILPTGGRVKGTSTCKLASILLPTEARTVGDQSGVKRLTTRYLVAEESLRAYKPYSADDVKKRHSTVAISLFIAIKTRIACTRHGCTRTLHIPAPRRVEQKAG
jgi:hypothetical protein